MTDDRFDIPHDDDDAAEHELVERGRALVAAAVADVRAPQSLRVAVERGVPERRGRVRARVAGGLVAMAAAAVVAVVAITGASTSGGAPSVLAVASLSARPIVEPAPESRADQPKLLRVAIDGVSFPYWDSLHWKASGLRRDTVGGRRAVTVFYDSDAGARLGYSIVAGEPLDEPAGTDVLRRGMTYRVVSRGARTIVTWQRSGHTCVISAPASVPRSRVLALAAWTGGGAVT